jgi:NitT/TauT family transport system substrate-binding protein
MQILQSRRRFLAGLSAAGAAGLVGSSTAAAEPPPEVTRIRTTVFPKVSDCQTPFYVAEDLLHTEGFTEIEYIEPASDAEWMQMLPSGTVDFDYLFAPEVCRWIDGGTPLTALTGMHTGCLELLAGRHVRTVRDLRGRRVGINEVNGLPHVLLRLVAANVGLDPEEEIEWIKNASSLDMLAANQIDAFLATPPDPQIARERGIGHVILNTTLDRPWSQYYCCMLVANVDFVRNYPVATKRVLRALLKAMDYCVSDPEAAARRSTEKGFSSSYDYALRTLADARFDVWRDFDPEDTVRYYALRLHELGMITTSPQEIIAKGTDWRFLNELKRELKA